MAVSGMAAGGRAGSGLVLGGLAGALALVLVLGWAGGATGVTPLDLLTGPGLSDRDRVILWDIRLPRLVLAALVGAGLAVSGALMQGLFRNPLADPGLVGVSAGASLGAVTAIVLGGSVPALAGFGLSLVPLAACAGGWAVTSILYLVARRQGQTDVATLLLAGIGLGALAMAVTGLLVSMADDAQLRDLTFWSLGSMAGATWGRLAVAGPVLVLAVLVAPLLARGLNALALGEAAAGHMGIAVEPLKRRAVVLVAAATGAAVAVSGGIGFVGLVVPHLVRLAAGPDHRLLLPASAMLGAAALVLADLAARLLVAPAELPIGIVTALVGAPAFLALLLGRRGGGDA